MSLCYRSGPTSRGSVWGVAVAAALMLCCGSVATASAADRPPSALLWLDGPSEVAGVGHEFTIAVRLDDISNVYGIDISLGFDETSLEVLDDGGAPGIQISAGDCPAPDFVVANTADNSAGTVHYAASQLAPTPPCSGGLVAEIRFRAIGPGVSVVEFTESIVSDSDGLLLTHDTQDLSVDVGHGGSLQFIGPGTAVQVGDEFSTEIQLFGVDDVYGAQIALSFDETCLEVLDDGGAPGIQILPGDCPQPDFVVENLASNAAGTIDYAVTQLNPTPACSGGLVATIRFRALQAATASVQFTGSIVSDSVGSPVPHVTQDLSLTIDPGPALLWLDGPSLVASVGDEFTVALRLDDISGVYGVDVSLAFDSLRLEVLDDGAAPGIQISGGDCPAPDFVAVNTADNAAGTIQYAVTQLAPTPPCSGGLVAEIRFRAIGSGVVVVGITESLVADPEGIPLPHGIEDLSIAIQPDPISDLLWLNGPEDSVLVGSEFPVFLMLGNLSGVYGADVSLGFDPSFLEVLDDGAAPGIQIATGDCPQPDFVVENAADNVAGTIDYAVTQLAPTVPCDGGVVAVVRFVGLQTGETEIRIEESIVADSDGALLPHDTQNVSVSLGAAAVERISWGTLKALYR